jgi:hypothetical protein
MVQMDKFIAIKVGKGDAFYLENMGNKILVDGGASRRKFPQQFSRTTGFTNVDIIICTHSDEDHVNGLIGYFEKGYKSREIWLPGSWLSRFDDMKNRPSDFINELINNIDELDDDFLRTSTDSLEMIGDIIARERWVNKGKMDGGSDHYQLELPYKQKESTEKISLSQNDNILSPTILSLKDDADTKMFSVQVGINQKWTGGKKEMIFNSAINAAIKILKLASLAYNSGAAVRWFEYSQLNSGGGEKYLFPVNSFEIFQAKRRVALEYLCLTKANVESLVFYSCNEDHTAGVLLCADSNFSFQQPLDFLKCCKNLIVTAPHHGAEANSNVYQELESYINSNTIFVRSDSAQSSAKTNPRPCKAYKNLQYSRFCTICFSTTSKQDVILKYNANSGWQSYETSLCVCY